MSEPQFGGMLAAHAFLRQFDELNMDNHLCLYKENGDEEEEGECFQNDDEEEEEEKTKNEPCPKKKKHKTKEGERGVSSCANLIGFEPMELTEKNQEREGVFSIKRGVSFESIQTHLKTQTYAYFIFMDKGSDKTILVQFRDLRLIRGMEAMFDAFKIEHTKCIKFYFCNEKKKNGSN